MWQDIDDFYVIDAVENLRKYLVEHEDINFVRGEVAFYDENDLNSIVRYGKSKEPSNQKILDSYVFQTDAYSYCGIWMARFQFFDKCVKNRQIYASRGGQNWQMILPLAYYGNAGYLDKVVYNQVIVYNSHSRAKHKNYEEAIRREETLQDILIHVLNEIGIYSKYERLLNEKYCRNKFNIAFKYNRKEELQKYKNELVSYRKLTIKEIIKLILIDFPKIKWIVFKLKKVI